MAQIFTPPDLENVRRQQLESITRSRPTDSAKIMDDIQDLKSELIAMRAEIASSKYSLRRTESRIQSQYETIEAQGREIRFLRREIRTLQKERNDLVDVVVALSSDVRGLAGPECIACEIDSDPVTGILEQYRCGTGDTTKIDAAVAELKMKKRRTKEDGEQPLEELRMHFQEVSLAASAPLQVVS